MEPFSSYSVCSEGRKRRLQKGKSMKISVLTENTVYKRGFVGEHGLSLLIENNSGKFLFDTGQTRIFQKNAKSLNENLEDLQGIILSHGHYDHCGGLGDWLNNENAMLTCPVYVNSAAWKGKYTKNPRSGQTRWIGIDWEAEICKDTLELIEEPKIEIADNMFLLSQVPYQVPFEPEPELFYHDEKGMIKDIMSDEQLLVIREERGLFVFAGCAHPGIINCLTYVQDNFPNEKIYGIFAGMHLKSCKKERLEATIQSLKELQPEIIIPMHCTGIMAIAAIKEQLGECCILAEAGKVINI